MFVKRLCCIKKVKAKVISRLSKYKVCSIFWLFYYYNFYIKFCYIYVLKKDNTYAAVIGLCTKRNYNSFLKLKAWFSNVLLKNKIIIKKSSYIMAYFFRFLYLLIFLMESANKTDTFLLWYIIFKSCTPYSDIIFYLTILWVFLLLYRYVMHHAFLMFSNS